MQYNYHILCWLFIPHERTVLLDTGILSGLSYRFDCWKDKHSSVSKQTAKSNTNSDWRLGLITVLSSIGGLGHVRRAM